MSSLPTLHLQELELLALTDAIKQSSTMEEAAKLVGLSRHALTRRIRKHRLDPPRPRNPERPGRGRRAVMHSTDA